MGFLDRFIKSSKKNNFQYLKNLIASDKKEIVLDSDIVLGDDEKNDFIDGIGLVENGMLIDGQGHTIDARGNVRIFNVIGQMITLKNIRFVNGHGGTTFEGSQSTKGDAILAQMDSKVSILDCEFTNHEGYAIFNLGNMKIEGCRFNANEVDFLNWNVMEINDLTSSRKGSFQNHGKLSAPSDVKGDILNEGELLDYVPLKDNPYDFDYLNKLICSQKEVMLSHDIKKNFINDEIIIDADDVTIDGCGHIIDGNYSGPIFKTNGKNITLKNLRFINGFYDGEGGAIRNTGEIRLENCEFFQNRANAGGAVYSYNGRIVANDVNFFDNSSAKVSWNEGGGALHVKGGTVELNGCDFRFNESASVGGAISLFDCEMKISDCSFKSNKSKDTGDDIHNLGTLFISSSRFVQSKTTLESIINERLLKIRDNHFNNIKIKNTNHLYIYPNDSESESKQVVIRNEGKIKAYGFDKHEIEFASIQNNQSVVFAEHEILPKFLTDQPQWVEIRVFISSTFKDMHAERDYLVTEVFPELKLWCRQRRIILNDIDLRWGVTENDSKSGNTIGVCLKSIDECKPFFLCFLGQRRGWVPDAGKKVDEKTFSRYPQIKDELGKLSITEMEIEHATLLPMVKILSEDSRQNARCSAFFFRQNPFEGVTLNDEQKGIYLNRDSQNDEKLDELKGMIKDDFDTYEYSCRWDENQLTSQLSVDAQNGRLVDFECDGRPLKDVIISELKSQIEEEFPDNQPIKSTDIYLEDAMLQYLEAKSRISNFAGKDNEIEYLNRFITSDEKILLIEGE